MKYLAKNYYFQLEKLLKSVEARDHKNKPINFYEALVYAAKLIQKQASLKKKIIFIGNGASAAISSHMAGDFCKNAQIRALAFNDASLLTCISNDLGYKYVFEKPIEIFADPGDVLIAISSSGKSENIIGGAKIALSKRMKVITLSGFSKNNPLSKLGELNFYVPQANYGHVEVIHHSICHCFLDIILQGRGRIRPKA